VGLAAGPGWTLLGYGVLGGTGAGIVYAICSVVLSAWYPERPAAHVGFVTGAFAYGSVPLVIAAPGHLGPAFVAAAVLAGAAVAVAAVFVRTPPARWWPPHLDPRAWSMGNRAFRANPRAPRDFSMGQAVRTGVLPALCVILVLAAGVSIFNVVSVAVLAAGMAPAAWAAVALLIAANGAGRAVAMVVSERAGRRPTLSFTLALLAAGQVLLASDTATGSPAGLTVSALVAGLGGGAFYPLIASLVRDYFGETGTTGIHAVVYSAKAVAGVLGAALVLLSATTWSHPHVSMLTGALAALSALLSTRLRQPGRPLTLPHAPPAQPHAPR
jgi:MFS family permease